MDLDVKYKHIISLGSFCSPAMEIERLGFRDGSYPFDWILSHSFQNVLKLINNHFENLFEIEDFYQWSDKRQIYANMKYDIDFVHDFTKYIPLQDQIDNVKEKYERRIRRFYDAIQEPTLFIRYVETVEQLDFVYAKYINIEQFLKQFNEKNEIIYILDSSFAKVEREKMNFYYVIKDEGDTVARAFMKQLPELQYKLECIYFSKNIRQNNLDLYRKKIKEKQVSMIDELKNKFIRKIQEKTRKVYIHSKQINRM